MENQNANRILSVAAACSADGGDAHIVGYGFLVVGFRGNSAGLSRPLASSRGRVPRLAAVEAEIARAQELAQQAGTIPNPTVSILPENFAGSRSFTGFDRLETTFQINQPLELGRKRGARQLAGSAEVDATRVRYAEAKAALAFDLAQAYVEAEAAGIMGMDWHSSGITTSVIGAFKRGLTPMAGELELYVCGGGGSHWGQR